MLHKYLLHSRDSSFLCRDNLRDSNIKQHCYSPKAIRKTEHSVLNLKGLTGGENGCSNILPHTILSGVLSNLLEQDGSSLIRFDHLFLHY